MLGKILPILLVVIGVAGGVGAGLTLRPEPDLESMTAEDGSEAATPAEPEQDEGAGPPDREYVKLNNQFVVPLVEEGAVNALVVMSFSIEVRPGNREAIFSREPRLRNSFLQVLFDHANVGGFRGAFTEFNNLEVLRAALLEVAIRDAGDDVTDVLILEIARQDY